MEPMQLRSQECELGASPPVLAPYPPLPPSPPTFNESPGKFFEIKGAREF